MRDTIKAWKVWDKLWWESGSTVVFAPTRGKARALALSTDTCEDIDFTAVGVRRFPEMDNAYRGRNEIDWYNMDDRLALVKLGWSCGEPDYDECKDCPVRDYCGQWEAYQHEED